MQHLTLKHFILKQQVLNLYRSTIRASRGIPNQAARRETVAWIRGEFERNRYITDVVLIEEKLKLGRREIDQILPATYSNSLSKTNTRGGSANTIHHDHQH